MAHGPVVHALGILDDGLAVPGKARSIVVPRTGVVVVELSTEQQTQIPLLLCTELGGEVSGEQVVEDVALYAVVLNLTLGVIGRTHLSNGHVVSRIDIETSLLTEGQLVVLTQTEVRRELHVGVTEHTVRVLTEIIVGSPPVGVVEVGGTERHLRGRITGNVCRSSFQVVLGRSTVNHVHHTVVSTRGAVDLRRSIVG